MKKDSLLKNKFRAKVKYNGNHFFSGDWVIGSLIIKSNGIFIYIIEEDEFGNIVRELDVDVIPETVGQYTGLKDINFSGVYENDYFDTEDGLMEVYFIDGKFILMWADNGTYRCDLCDAVKHLSKCGNKFDNPELLTN